MNPIAFKSAIVSLAGALLALCGGLWHSSEAVVLTEGQIKDKVVAHVQEQVAQVVDPADVKNIHVSIIRVPAAPFDFPAAKTPHDIKVSLTSRLGETYSPRGIVQVSLQDGMGHQREIGVPVQISIHKPVWVVKNVVSAHEPLRASDFSLQSKDVSNCYQYAVGADRNLGTYLARVNLRPGDILDARKIVIPPDVTYNSPVRIFISNGDGMTVTVPGIALADGKIGETIRVRQAVFQRKYYSAKIVDKNKVLVEM